jgi:hypothetical protein
MLQPPQLCPSVAVSVSHPFALIPSQSARPALHAHVPLAQSWNGAHARPHAPQLSASLPAFTSQPFTMFPSQSRNGSTQLVTQ